MEISLCNYVNYRCTEGGESEGRDKLRGGPGRVGRKRFAQIHPVLDCDWSVELFIQIG